MKPNPQRLVGGCVPESRNLTATLLAAALIVLSLLQAGCRAWCPTCRQDRTGSQCVVLGGTAADTLRPLDPVWLPSGPGETWSIRCLRFVPGTAARAEFVDYAPVANGNAFTAFWRVFRPAAYDSTTADTNVYTVRLALRRPSNAYLEQAAIDVMVSGVDSGAPPVAWLRFAGMAGPVPDTLARIDSAGIADYAASHCATIHAAPLTLHGADAPAAVRGTEIDTIIAYLDGRPVPRDTLRADGRFDPVRSPSFYGNTSSLAFTDVPVRVGQMLLYQSLAGVRYLVVVGAIFRDPAPPRFAHVVLRFIEIGTEECYICNRL